MAEWDCHAAGSSKADALLNTTTTAAIHRHQIQLAARSPAQLEHAHHRLPRPLANARNAAAPPACRCRPRRQRLLLLAHLLERGFGRQNIHHNDAGICIPPRQALDHFMSRHFKGRLPHGGQCTAGCLAPHAVGGQHQSAAGAGQQDLRQAGGEQDSKDKTISR